MAEMTALNNNKQGKKEDKPATAREIAEAAERRLNKVLISKEAMKANIGHTASMGLQGGTTIGSAGVSSLVVGMTPQQHRNKVRVVRGLTALGLAVIRHPHRRRCLLNQFRPWPPRPSFGGAVRPRAPESPLNTSVRAAVGAVPRQRRDHCPARSSPGGELR